MFDSLSLSLSRAPARPPLSLMFSLLNAPNATHQQLPENGGGGPGGAISSLFRSLAGTKGSGDPDVAPASSSTAVGPAVSTDSSLASGKAPPLARSDAFQSSANAGKLLGGGTFPETGDPTTGNQVPVPATLSSKAQSAAPADWVPPASGQLAPRDKDYDAESSTLSTAQAKTNNVLNGVTVGARAEAAIEEEEKGAARGGTTSALAAAASGLAPTPRARPSSSASLDAAGAKSFKSAKPEQLAKLVAPAGPNSQAAGWRNATQPQPAPGVVPTLRSMDQNIAALDAAQGVPPVPATSVLSDGSIAGGNANYGKQVDVTISANLTYPGTGLRGEKVTVRVFPGSPSPPPDLDDDERKEERENKSHPSFSLFLPLKKTKTKPRSKQTGLPLPLPDLPGHRSRPLHRQAPLLAAAGRRPAPRLRRGQRLRLCRPGPGRGRLRPGLRLVRLALLVRLQRHPVLRPRALPVHAAQLVPVRERVGQLRGPGKQRLRDQHQQGHQQLRGGEGFGVGVFFFPGVPVVSFFAPFFGVLLAAERRCRGELLVRRRCCSSSCCFSLREERERRDEKRKTRPRPLKYLFATHLTPPLHLLLSSSPPPPPPLPIP